MTSWSDLRASVPEIAESGQKLLFQFGMGLAFLATVRADGGPRLHPVCVNLVDDCLQLLIVQSLKRRDLLRDGRFALHSFPSADSDDEFYLTGRARQIQDPELLKRIEAAQHAGGATTSGDEEGFSLDIERALYSRYGPRGEPNSWPPTYLKWRAQ